MKPGVLDIKAPLITSKEPITNPFRVYRKSPIQHRKAVHDMALYFKREFNYDFPQYDYREEKPDELLAAYLWVHPDFIDFAVDFRIPCIGAACFRLRNRADAPSSWAMQWVWFHPYLRRKGLLAASWPHFNEGFPDFICEPPLSESMELFLKKVDPAKLGTETNEEA